MPEISVSLTVSENGRRSPEYTLDTDLNGKVSLEDFLKFTKQSLLTIATSTLEEEQANGFDLKPVVVTDGKVGKPIEFVNPLGKISFISRAQSTEIVRETYRAIINRSPIDTGLYISSNYVFLNSKRIATSETEFNIWLENNGDEIKDKDIFQFINLEPYARRLENLGITAQKRAIKTRKSRDREGRSGTGGKILAPNGAYFLTSRAIQRKYGKNSKISFGFIPGSLLGLSAVFKTAGKPSKYHRKSSKVSTYLYPVIKISISGEGTV